MNKPVRVVLLGEADEAYKKLNSIVGKQIEVGKENTDEMQLLRSIRQKIEQAINPKPAPAKNNAKNCHLFISPISSPK